MLAVVGKEAFVQVGEIGIASVDVPLEHVLWFRPSGVNSILLTFLVPNSDDEFYEVAYV